MDAAKAGHVDLVGFLLEHGADPLAKVSSCFKEVNQPGAHPIWATAVNNLVFRVGDSLFSQ